MHSQLEAELGEVFASRGLELPASIPPEGILGRREDGDARPASRSVSVVVPICGYTARFERCLRSNLASLYGDFEVIVVDNRPHSGATRAMIAERFAGDDRLRCVEEPRRGLSAARNASLVAARGDVVAFTDDDGRQPGLDRARRRGVRPGPRRRVRDRAHLPFGLDSDSQLLLEQFATFSKGFDARTIRLPDALDEHPLLSTGTPAAGGEDSDLYIRLLREGHAIAYGGFGHVWRKKRFAGTARTAVRKAERSGLTVERDTTPRSDRRRQVERTLQISANRWLRTAQPPSFVRIFGLRFASETMP